MIEKLAYLHPEIALFITTCVVLVIGQSKSLDVRRFTAFVAGAGILIAGGLAANTPADPAALFPNMMPFTKALIAIIGLMLLMLLVGTVDRGYERAIAKAKAPFDPLRANRSEFYAFFLFSLTGLMLCASADDLIWLFLALELTSLPTYIMVTVSTRGTRSQEAGVKYFFLGALGAAIFLYGFALIYGATGTTDLALIAQSFAEQSAKNGSINAIGIAGLVIAMIGLGFKIAAVPMHFYTADVYQGAAASVSAMLAFVPKMAGVLAIILIAAVAGWTHGDAGTSLPEPVRLVLWVMAALTMTVGNVLALLQSSIKRLLAYSSIAHSGYILVGIIAGPGVAGLAGDSDAADNGVAAALFYMLCYGVMNLGAFAVVACLERRDVSEMASSPDNDDRAHELAAEHGYEVDQIDDYRGLIRTRPVLAWVLVISSFSMLGLPPLLGFFGKLGLFVSGVSAGEIPLVVILGLNSAIAALYYLRLITVPFLDQRGPRDQELAVETTALSPRRLAALLSAGGVLVLVVPGVIGFLSDGSREAGTPGDAMPAYVDTSTHGDTNTTQANLELTERADIAPSAPANHTASVIRSIPAG